MDDEDLLQPLREAGAADEPGAFSIDLGRARARLRDYLLPQRAMYVLKLLQSAVLAGATSFHLRTTRDRVIVDHNGVPPTTAQLAGLLGYVLPAEGAPAFLNPLATAANTAFSDDEVADVAVEAWTGEDLQRLVLRRDDSTMDRHASSAKWEGVRFVMHRPRRSWDLFSTWREALLITSLGRFAPLRVLVDEREVTAAPFGGEGEIKLALGPSWRYVGLLQPWHATRYFGKGYHVAESRFPVESPHGIGLSTSCAYRGWVGKWGGTEVLHGFTRSGGADFKRYHAALALRADTSLNPEVSLVRLGVVVGHVRGQNLPPGLEGVLCVDDAATDASGLQLTQEGLQSVIPAIHRNADRLLEVVNPDRSDPLSYRLAQMLCGNPEASLSVR